MTVHETGCTRCDAARATVADLALWLDPLGAWPETPMLNVPGVTVGAWLVERVAMVLHRNPYPGPVPVSDQDRREIDEDQAAERLADAAGTGR